jgi:hypothetical protein
MLPVMTGGMSIASERGQGVQRLDDFAFQHNALEASALALTEGAL